MKQIRLQTIALDTDRGRCAAGSAVRMLCRASRRRQALYPFLAEKLDGEVSSLGGKQEEGADVGDHVVIQPQQLLSLESLEEIRSEAKRFFDAFKTVLDDKKKRRTNMLSIRRFD